jgi:hypothetical protein
VDGWPTRGGCCSTPSSRCRSWPGAAVILLTLPVVALLELLVWLPLLPNHRIRAARGQPAKQVNPPASAEDLIGGQMDSLVVQAALGLILLFAVFAALASVLTELVTGSWACAANTSCAGIRPSSTPLPLPVGHG